MKVKRLWCQKYQYLDEEEYDIFEIQRHNLQA